MAIQFTPTSTPLPNIDTSALSAYHLRDREEVLRFLEMNDFLLPLLHEAYSTIMRCFGSETSVALEIRRDPEGEDAEELFAFIQTTDPAEVAIEKLHRLDDNWWLMVSPRAQCKMNISLEFL